MAKQARTQKTVHERHRARKGRPPRPLDVAREDNHAFNLAAARRAAWEEELMRKRQAEEKQAPGTLGHAPSFPGWPPPDGQLPPGVTPDVELEAVAEEMVQLKGRLLRLAVDLPLRSPTLPLVHSVAARLVLDHDRLRRRREGP